MRGIVNIQLLFCNQSKVDTLLSDKRNQRVTSSHSNTKKQPKITTRSKGVEDCNKVYFLIVGNLWYVNFPVETTPT
jgi:6-phosphogluconolactonase/glucosamine-6-phosphate isomerase/deaminase